MVCSVYTEKKNLINSKRTAGYFCNTSILNLIFTEKSYLILLQWPLMKNLILSYHLSCAMASLSKSFRMWPFLAEILHCYQIQCFSACALTQPKPLGHLSLMQTRLIPSVIFQRIIVCVWHSTTTTIWLRGNLYPFFLRIPTDIAQFYQGCLTK